MSRRKIDAKPPENAVTVAHEGANGYMHVATPATASEILRDLGISKAEVKRILHNLKFVSAGS
jgi:DNA invertase Pin-like site-specific DNA recombinase